MSEAIKVKFPGEEIQLGDNKYILPKLGLNAYSKHKAFEKIQGLLKVVSELLPNEVDTPKELNESAITALFKNVPAVIKKLANIQLPEGTIDSITELIYLALARNYPNMTPQTVEENLDLITAITSLPLILINNAEDTDKLRKNDMPPQVLPTKKN